MQQVKDDLDEAYALLQRKSNRTANREAALKILLEAEDKKDHLDPSLRQQIYWDLMNVEKDLSGSSKLVTAKREHINQAQRYNVEVRKIAQQSSDEILDAQVSLEQHQIEGRKAILNNDGEELERLKSRAKDGIDRSLRKL